MKVNIDSDKFPTIEIPELGVSIGALPFTKRQYEWLWVRRGSDLLPPFSDSCYESCLALNPRPKPSFGSRTNSAMNPSRTFWLTGLDPIQAQQVQSSFGAFSFPRRELWLEVKRILEARRFDKEEAERWLRLPLCEEANRALLSAWREIPPQNWAQATLMKDGVLEWAISPPRPRKPNETDFVAIGSPANMTIVPEMGNYSRYHQGDRLSDLHGFRVWRKL